MPRQGDGMTPTRTSSPGRPGVGDLVGSHDPVTSAGPVPERRSAAEPLRAWDPRRAPGGVQALLVLAASRLLVWYVAYRAASLAARHPDGSSWGYLEIANNWDGTWYQRVASQGYPTQ